MGNDEYILEARGLHKSFGPRSGRVHVLRGLDLAVGAGEFLAVMGPSGCGKSTLLHLLGLMARPDEGEVLFAGQPTGGLGEEKRAVLRRRLGFVFQRFNLLGALSGRDNIALSLRLRGMEDDGRIDSVLEALGIAELARRKPAEMSIGQQQRFAVARALAAGPEVLLADEPTGSLDSENRRALLELFRQANRQGGQTIVMITHSAEVAAAADRILHMRDGRIIDEDG